ncbi:hypothetical protein KSP39_PZI001894 [Platanthera zijinensis]|uniref:Uncharacterized protein n=1 Tax=Platanthera zijinensis TaxID=2320716 RepID=A0AAP0GE94_9ASPA
MPLMDRPLCSFLIHGGVLGRPGQEALQVLVGILPDARWEVIQKDPLGITNTLCGRGRGPENFGGSPLRCYQLRDLEASLPPEPSLFGEWILWGPSPRPAGRKVPSRIADLGHLRDLQFTTHVIGDPPFKVQFSYSSIDPPIQDLTSKYFLVLHGSRTASR